MASKSAVYKIFSRGSGGYDGNENPR